jgi:hypothetical protein
VRELGIEGVSGREAYLSSLEWIGSLYGFAASIAPVLGLLVG